VPAKRRIGAEDSESRSALVEAAQRLMLREGYASVTSRKVAAEAGLKPQLVHYYFETMDDLFLAVLRRGADRNLERLERALESDDPLRALWDLDRDPAGVALTQEFAALVNHRKAVRAEFAAYAERFRRREIEAVAAIVDRARGDEPWPAEALVVLLSSVGRMLVLESDLGLTTGHAEIVAVVERLISETGT
jgi:AcrR family transcriptional regulator